MTPPPTRSALALALALGASLALGCASTRRLTDTPRTATEQLLVSHAIEDAIEALEWPALEGRAVSIAVVSLGSPDADFVRAAAEVRARGLGARVVPAEQADLLVTLLASAVGTTSREAEFGMPSLPTPFGATPSLPVAVVHRQRAYARLRAEAHDAAGRRVFHGAPAMRRARYDITRILFFAVRTNDVYPDLGRVGFD